MFVVVLWCCSCRVVCCVVLVVCMTCFSSYLIDGNVECLLQR